jgi:diguanylate cyclase (GGDEF)-like protein
LIAEDEAVSRLVLLRSVQRLGHTVVVASDGDAAWKAYKEEPPDVIISDWVMPGIEGIEFCRRVREVEKSSYTYFIFMTALADKSSLLRGMEAGADDYLTKPVDLDDLEARLLAAMRVTKLHRRLIEQNEDLARLSRASFEAARVDPLTRVANRLRLREDLEALRPRVVRYGHSYAAALCDVDHFKRYNDHHGHLAGDEALRAVAAAIAKGLRKGDEVYRYGGEEFLVLLPEQTEARATIALERLRASVEALALPHHGIERPAVVTMSVGIAAMLKDDDAPWEGWIRRADIALYRAKGDGRNCVRSYGGS